MDDTTADTLRGYNRVQGHLMLWHGRLRGDDIRTFCELSTEFVGVLEKELPATILLLTRALINEACAAQQVTALAAATCCVFLFGSVLTVELWHTLAVPRDAAKSVADWDSAHERFTMSLREIRLLWCSLANPYVLASMLMPGIQAAPRVVKSTKFKELLKMNPELVAVVNSYFKLLGRAAVTMLGLMIIYPPPEDNDLEAHLYPWGSEPLTGDGWVVLDGEVVCEALRELPMAAMYDPYPYLREHMKETFKWPDSQVQATDEALRHFVGMCSGVLAAQDEALDRAACEQDPLTAILAVLDQPVLHAQLPAGIAYCLSAAGYAQVHSHLSSFTQDCVLVREQLAALPAINPRLCTPHGFMLLSVGLMVSSAIDNLAKVCDSCDNHDQELRKADELAIIITLRASSSLIRDGQLLPAECIAVLQFNHTGLRNMRNDLRHTARSNAHAAELRMQGSSLLCLAGQTHMGMEEVHEDVSKTLQAAQHHAQPGAQHHAQLGAQQQALQAPQERALEGTQPPAQLVPQPVNPKKSRMQWKLRNTAGLWDDNNSVGVGANWSGGGEGEGGGSSGGGGGMREVGGEEGEERGKGGGGGSFEPVDGEPPGQGNGWRSGGAGGNGIHIQQDGGSDAAGDVMGGDVGTGAPGEGPRRFES